MEIDWSTSILEIINFVILVWILKRFLYKPVLNVIEQRQIAINEKLRQAEDLKTQADILLKSYNNRLSDWEREKQLSRQALDQDIQQERAIRLQQIKDEIDAERKKAAVVEQRKQTELQQQAESTAITMAARFVAKLFTDLSGPEVEKRLIKLFITGLHAMPEDRRHAMRSSAGDVGDKIDVYTVYPLDSPDSEMLELALHQLAGDGASIFYARSDELVAGIKVVIGAFVLQANLKDELNDFARFAHDDAAP